MDNFNGTLSKKIIRTVLFLVIGVLILAAVAVLSALPGTNRFFAAVSGADFDLCQGYEDVTPVIQLVQEESQAQKLIIGDSVCKQLFSGFQEQNPQYCIAGTYCTVGISGQYLLAKEFLDSHQTATDIYLIIRPQSMSAILDSQKAYMYAVAPFAATGTIGALDDVTLEEMRQMYWNCGINRWTAAAIVNSPMLAKVYLNLLQTVHYVEDVTTVEVSDISARYLEKIEQLCEERQVTLHILANPLPDNEINRYVVEHVSEQMRGTAVESLMEELCGSVLYYDETLFPDGQHFDLEQIDAREVIASMQQKYQELLDLDIGVD